jgi:hypothetical protein
MKMGDVTVRRVENDPLWSDRVVIAGEATSLSMATSDSGNQQLILRAGETLTASVPRDEFPAVSVDETIDGNRFCRAARGYIIELT